MKQLCQKLNQVSVSSTRIRKKTAEWKHAMDGAQITQVQRLEPARSLLRNHALVVAKGKSESFDTTRTHQVRTVLS